MKVVRPDDIGTPLKLVLFDIRVCTHSLTHSFIVWHFFDIIMYGNGTVNLELENVERKEEDRLGPCHSKILSYETPSHIQKEGETDQAQTGAAMEKQTQTNLKIKPLEGKKTLKENALRL